MIVRWPTLLRSGARCIAPVCIAMALAGCQSSILGLSSPPASDVRTRYPVLLAEVPRTLDIIGWGMRDGGLRQRQELAAFIADYRREGRAAMTVNWLGGTVPEARVQRKFEARLRRHLELYGLAAGDFRFVPTAKGRNEDALPVVRLSYVAVQAVVPAACESYRSDLGGIASIDRDLMNEPSPLFGCATQSAFARTMDDPLDLVRPRLESPADLPSRLRGLETLRAGRTSASSRSSVAQDVSPGSARSP